MLELKKQSVLQLKEEAERRGGKGMNSGMSGDHRATAVSKSDSFAGWVSVSCRFWGKRFSISAERLSVGFF